MYFILFPATQFSVLRSGTMDAILLHTLVFRYMLTAKLAVFLEQNLNTQENDAQRYNSDYYNNFFHLSKT